MCGGDKKNIIWRKIVSIWFSIWIKHSNSEYYKSRYPHFYPLGASHTKSSFFLKPKRFHGSLPPLFLDNKKRLQEKSVQLTEIERYKAVITMEYFTNIFRICYALWAIFMFLCVVHYLFFLMHLIGKNSGVKMR